METHGAALGVEELDQLTAPVLTEFVTSLLGAITSLVLGLLGGGA